MEDIEGDKATLRAGIITAAKGLIDEKDLDVITQQTKDNTVADDSFWLWDFDNEAENVDEWKARVRALILERSEGGGFPRTLRKEGRKISVKNDEELKEAQSEGWK